MNLKLPTFIIIGANKAGTTSLFLYLKQHPDVFMPAVKEPMFFTAKPRLKGEIRRASLSHPVATTTLEEYAALFQDSRPDQARGEASTAYLANPHCAAKIREIIPDVRLIAVLRNPIDRAFSNYLMYWGSGIETRTFDRCVSDEVEHGCGSTPQGQRYLQLSLYAAAIEQFQEVFGREALMVVRYDDFEAEPGTVYRLALEHIRVDPSFVPDLSVRSNRAEDYLRTASRPQVLPAVRERLSEHFRADIERLVPLVGFDPTAWLQA